MKLPNMRPARVALAVASGLAIVAAAGVATPASAAPLQICGSISNCATLAIVPSPTDTGSARIPTATSSTGAAAQVTRNRIPINLRPLRVPRPLARRAVQTAGIQVRQASNDGGYEPLIATFRSAKCRRQGGGFVVDARPPARGFEFSVQIPRWKGYKATYPLVRRDDQYGVQVLVSAPGEHVYDSSVTVPGFPGAGGVVFAHDGSAISVGGTFFEQGDMNRGVTVAGAMSCTRPKKGKKR